MTRRPDAGLYPVSVLFLLVAGWLVSPAAAHAQIPDTRAVEPWTYAPAHIAVIDGEAVLERGGRVEPAASAMPLVAGDRVRTSRGRLEILFEDGSALDLDHYSTLDVQSDALVRLLGGRMRLTVAADTPGEPVDYRIDTPAGTVEIRAAGDYRISLLGGGGRGDEVELAVIRGAADLVTASGAVAVGPGQRSLARADAPPAYPYVYNSAYWDAFDRWAEERRDARLGVASSAYLPEPLYPYGATFDHHGSWRHDPAYGYVWYPRVAVDWRPYSYGHWSVIGSFGLTWIGYDPWAWPTHHYGRWGFGAGAWFWIPGRRWAPAWVSWAWSPGYVGWCPLGYDGRPIVGFTSVRAYRGRSDPWHGWTVVPHRYFGARARPMSTFAVSVTALDRHAIAEFRTDRAVPLPAGYAIPRDTAPIRSAGLRAGTAVPRGAQAGPQPSAPSGPTSATARGLADTSRRIAPRQRSTPALGTLAAPSTATRRGAVRSPSSDPSIRAPRAASPTEATRRARPGVSSSAAPSSTAPRAAVPRAPRAPAGEGASSDRGRPEPPRPAAPGLARPRAPSAPPAARGPAVSSPRPATPALSPRSAAPARRAPASSVGPERPSPSSARAPVRSPARVAPQPRGGGAAGVSGAPRGGSPPPAASAPARPKSGAVRRPPKGGGEADGGR